MRSYCIKEKKQTECAPGSERYERANNGRLMLKCQCVSCGITKTKFVKNTQEGGNLFLDHLVKDGAKGLYNLGRLGASRAVKSDFAKRKIKGVMDKYIDQTLDTVTSDLSKKLDPFHKGGAIDIHKAIGRLPKPKKGVTLPGHYYTGPYDPLDEQLRYDPETGQILEYYQKPTGSTDTIAAQHDVDYSVCKDDKKCKNKADRKMVKALDMVPFDQRQWGHWLARNAINTKQKLGLGVKKSKNGRGR